MNDPPEFVDGFSQSFETDTSGLLDGDSSWHGDVQRVSSGTGGIASPDGGSHAIVTQGTPPATETGPFTRFDGYRDTWPGEWTAEVKVYLDTDWAAGEGFDYSVAANGSDGNHQRDYIFHVTKDTSTGKLLVAGSNNTNFEPREDLDTLSNNYEVETSGWYTLKHRFYDDGGVLAVDLMLVDAAGVTVFTETRKDNADTIGTGGGTGGEVGGNRYGWFTNIDIDGGIAVDGLKLTVPGTGDTEGAVTELPEGDPGENVDTLTSTGSLPFIDVDLTDDHTVSVTPGASDYRGTLTAEITDSANGDGFGIVEWTFSVDDAALDDLTAGEVLTQTYEVKVDDGNGGFDTATVTITITGSADAPVVTPSVSEVSFVEADNADTGGDRDEPRRDLEDLFGGLPFTVSDSDGDLFTEVTLSLDTSSPLQGESLGFRGNFFRFGEIDDVRVNTLIEDPRPGGDSVTIKALTTLTARQVEVLLANVLYGPGDRVTDANIRGDVDLIRTIKVSLTDDSGETNDTGEATFDIAITGVNDRPFLTFGNTSSPFTEVTATIAEDTSIKLEDFRNPNLFLRNPDNDGDALKVILTASNGTLSWASLPSGVTSNEVATGTQFELTGSLDDLQRALRDATFTPDQDYSGSDAQVFVEVYDEAEETGKEFGFDRTKAEVTFKLDVTPVTDAPVVEVADIVAFEDLTNAPPVDSLQILSNAFGDFGLRVVADNVPDGSVIYVELPEGTNIVGQPGLQVGRFAVFTQAQIGSDNRLDWNIPLAGPEPADVTDLQTAVLAPQDGSEGPLEVTAAISASVGDSDGSESLTSLKIALADQTALSEIRFDGIEITSQLVSSGGSLVLTGVTYIDGTGARVVGSVTVDVAFDGTGLVLTFDPADRVQAVDTSQFSLVLAQHADDDFQVQVTATADENAGGVESASASATADVTVKAVADQPTVSIDPVVVPEDGVATPPQGPGDGPQTVTTPIAAAVVDDDGSESLTELRIAVVGFPGDVAGAATFDGTRLAEIFANQGPSPFSGELTVQAEVFGGSGPVDVTATAFFDGTGLVLSFDAADRVQSVAITQLGLIVPQHFNGSFTVNAAATSTETNPEGAVSVAAAVATASGTVTITPVNDAPTIDDLPDSVTVAEDTPSDVDLSAATFADVDSGDSPITLTIASGLGILTATDGGGVTVTGSGTGTIVLTGSVGDIDAFLDSPSNIQYTGPADLNGTGADALTLTANDGGASGEGDGQDIDLGTVAVDITPVNDAPTITGPAGPFTVLPADSVTIGGLAIADVDTVLSPDGIYTVTLTVGSGSLAAAATPGVTATGGGTGTLVLSGTLADVNTALAGGIVFTAPAIFPGAALTLDATVSDNGNEGPGAPLTDTLLVAITVLPDVAPTLLNAGGDGAPTGDGGDVGTPGATDPFTTIDNTGGAGDPNTNVNPDAGLTGDLPGPAAGDVGSPVLFGVPVTELAAGLPEGTDLSQFASLPQLLASLAPAAGDASVPLDEVELLLFGFPVDEVALFLVGEFELSTIDSRAGVLDLIAASTDGGTVGERVAILQMLERLGLFADGSISLAELQGEIDLFGLTLGEMTVALEGVDLDDVTSLAELQAALGTPSVVELPSGTGPTLTSIGAPAFTDQIASAFTAFDRDASTLGAALMTSNGTPPTV